MLVNVNCLLAEIWTGAVDFKETFSGMNDCESYFQEHVSTSSQLK